MENIFDLQAEISEKIAQQLNVEFSSSSRDKGVDAGERKEAEDYVRKGRRFAYPPNPRTYLRALRLFEFKSSTSSKIINLSFLEIDVFSIVDFKFLISSTLVFLKFEPFI